MNAKLENLQYHGGDVLETIDCPLCRGKQFKTLVVENALPVVRCRACSLTFVNPRPDAAGLLKFYENYFPPESESLWQTQMADVFLKEGIHKLEELKASGVLRYESGKKLRLLDIGCGMGFFLELMQKQGWEVEGVEPSPDAVKHARQKLNLQVTRGTLETAILSGSYDVITLWYVLEHVPNPHEILDKAALLIKKGGILIIRVPNQNAPIDQILGKLGLGRFSLINPPRHLSDYSPKTISELLKRRGFQVLDIRNAIPRATGTPLELIRRYLWYGFFELLYWISFKKIIRGSSMTIYAQKI